MGEPGVDLRVSRGLDLLVALKQTVADFAKREELLTRDLLSRRGAANRKHRDGIEKADTRVAAQIADTEKRFSAEEKRVNAIYAQRRGRIDQLGVVGLRNLPRRAEAEKGRWMGELQMRRFHAERNRDAGLKAADSEAADFAVRRTGNIAMGSRKRTRGWWRRSRIPRRVLRRKRSG